MPPLRPEDLARNKKFTSQKKTEVDNLPEMNQCLPGFDLGICRFFNCLFARSSRTADTTAETRTTSVPREASDQTSTIVTDVNSISTAPTMTITTDHQVVPPHPVIQQYASMALYGVQQVVAAGRMLLYLRCITYIRVPQGLDIADTALTTAETMVNRVVTTLVNHYIVPFFESIAHRYNTIFHSAANLESAAEMHNIAQNLTATEENILPHNIAGFSTSLLGSSSGSMSDH